MNAKKIIHFAIGPVASAIIGLITIPIVAWTFSPEDVGRFNLLQVTISFSLLLLVLGLDQAYVREFHGSSDKASLLKACFAPGFLLLLVCALATLSFGTQLSGWIFGETNQWFYPLTIICVTVTYISRFFSLILRMQERGVAFSINQIIPKLLQLFFLLGVVVFGVQRNFLILLCMTVVSSLAVVLVYAWNTHEQWRPAITATSSTGQTRALLNFGLPLVASGLAYWGLTATSTLVLRSQSTLSELGIYSVTGSFAGAAAVFQSILTVVWAPTVYKWVSQGVDMKRIDAIAHQALAVVCIIFVLVGMFSWLTDYVLPTHYINIKYLVLCAIAPPLLYSLSEITYVGIGISRRTVLSVWVTLAALATNVLLSLWLIPTHGAAGAVMANALAYVVFFVARTEASAYVWRQFPRKKLYFFVGLATAFSVATVTLGPSLPFHFALAWLAMVPFVSWCFRTEWAELFATVRNA